MHANCPFSQKRKGFDNSCKFSSCFPTKQVLTFMRQMVSNGDNLHGMSKTVFGKNKKKYHQFVFCCISPESDFGYITKTRLFKYTENFTTKKIENFQIKILIFLMFLLKT